MEIVKQKHYKSGNILYIIYNGKYFDKKVEYYDSPNNNIARVQYKLKHDYEFLAYPEILEFLNEIIIEKFQNNILLDNTNTKQIIKRFEKKFYNEPYNIDWSNISGFRLFYNIIYNEDSNIVWHNINNSNDINAGELMRYTVMLEYAKDILQYYLVGFYKPYAHNLLAELYRINEQYNLAKKHYMIADSLKNNYAMWNAYNMLVEVISDNTAIAMLKRAASFDNPAAIYNILSLYKGSLTVDKYIEYVDRLIDIDDRRYPPPENITISIKDLKKIINKQ